MALSSTHVLYITASVGGPRSLWARCGALVISFGTEVVACCELDVGKNWPIECGPWPLPGPRLALYMQDGNRKCRLCAIALATARRNPHHGARRRPGKLLIYMHCPRPCTGTAHTSHLQRIRFSLSGRLRWLATLVVCQRRFETRIPIVRGATTLPLTHILDERLRLRTRTETRPA
jgi:hypothetical protein